MHAFAVCKTGALLAALLLAGCTSDTVLRGAPAPPGPTPTPPAAPIPTSVLQAVGEEGGMVAAVDGRASVTLPTGAVGTLTNVSVAAVQAANLPSGGAGLLSGAYEFGPDSAVFLQPVTLAVKATATAGIGQQLVLAYLDGNSTWVPVGSSVFDANTAMVSARLQHFSVYAVVAVDIRGFGCPSWVDADTFCAPQICVAQSNRCDTPPVPTYYAVTGNITGMVQGTSVTVHDDSENDFVVNYPQTQFGLGKQFMSGQSYSVSVAGSPGLRCVLLAASGVLTNSNVNLSVTCSVSVTFATNQAASMVLGQPNFVTGSANGAAQNLFRYPAGPVFLSSNGTLYVADADNARIAGFHTLPHADAAGIDFVLGQNDFVSRDFWPQATPAATDISPDSVVADDNYLVAADGYTNRVLIYTPVPDGSSSQPVAVAAMGQPDTVTGSNAGCSPTTLATPAGVLLFHGKLLVADRYNHRVLIWNRAPTASGVAPDLVLGQPNFTTCNHPGGVSPTTLAQPIGMWTDGTRLLVVDRDSSRVLAWNTFPTVNQQPADGFLGQVDFYSADGATDPAVGSNWPSSVTSDGNIVIVTEPLRHRITVWGGWPDAHHSPPLLSVLGQADTGGNACNKNNAVPDPNTLCDPEGVALIGTQLWVTDSGNSRVLVYDSM